tara:strand:+ start:509 stop:1147 length:639 start_codon:yes stop_codon:yes gene_type:complete
MAQLPATTEDLLTHLDNAIARVNASDGDVGDFLKLTKAEEWIYGKDGLETQEGSKWAIDPRSFAMGFIAWSEDSKVLGDHMASVYSAPVLQSELPSVDADWDEQVAFNLTCVSGEDKKTRVVYKTTTQGGVKEFKRVLMELRGRAKAGQEEIVPVVLLQSDSYQHSVKKYGRVITPIFNITEWHSLDAGVEDVDQEVLEDEKPKGRRRRKVA